MFRTKLRRALAVVALVSAVLLLPVQTAGAMPRGGVGRDGGYATQGILAHWGHLAWGFFANLLEKGSTCINPDGVW